MKTVRIAAIVMTLVYSLVPSALAADEQPVAKIDLYLSLIAHWKNGDIEGVLDMLDEDIVWHFAAGNAAPVMGKAAAKIWIDGFASQVRNSKWRVTGYAEVGNRLFIEGVEDYMTPSGERVLLPYAGMYEYKDNKIVGWRDYFDRMLSDNLKAGQAIPDYVTQLASVPAISR